MPLPAAKTSLNVFEFAVEAIECEPAERGVSAGDFDSLRMDNLLNDPYACPVGSMKQCKHRGRFGKSPTSGVGATTRLKVLVRRG